MGHPPMAWPINDELSLRDGAYRVNLLGWLVVLRICVDLAIFSHIMAWKQEKTNL